jgi:hypothetical protein
MKKTLPEWFDGEIYEEGCEVTNLYSGESCVLTGEELSMYDFIKGVEMILSHTTGDNSLVKRFYDGISWFQDNNPKAYMTLLD